MKSLPWLIIWCSPLCLPAQDADLLFPHLTEDYFALQDDGAVTEDMYENLMHILSSPYDLNQVTREQLRSMNILSDPQIEAFITYRNEQQHLLDIYELQIIPGFDLPTIEKLLPFVAVRTGTGTSATSFARRLFSPGHTYFLSRYERTLETKKGFLSGDTLARFKGSPDKMYYRLRSFQPGDYSIGIAGEKDAGEQLHFRPREGYWGFDFTSYHLQLQEKGKLKNLILGDFQAQFAQGLSLGSAFGLAKGASNVSATRKSNLGFLPYTSINERAHQRGIALQMEPAPWMNIFAFYASTRRDAMSENTADSLTITSIQTTGFHRTASELAKRRNVRERHAGVALHFGKNQLDAGIILNTVSFGSPVRRTATLYNQFAFHGRSTTNAGVFLNYGFENVALFSEVSQTLGSGRGVIAGLLITPHQSLDISMLYRSYDRDFHTFYTNAFSEGTAPQNERGVYWAWTFKTGKHYTFAGYVDLFSFPWLGFRRYAPSAGYEWLLRTQYQPSKKSSIILHVREESKFRNLAEMNTLYRPEEGLKRNVAVLCDYGIGQRIRLKTRMQYSNYTIGDDTTEGWALAQDVSLTIGPLKFSGRHALFDTDHYDNRQYMYEQDAWLAYSLPAYDGVGVRNYALIEIKVHKHLTLWLRYARTRLVQREKIGSGLDEISGNTRNDVKFQVRFKF